MWVLVTEMMQQVITMLVAGFVEGTGVPWPGVLIMATTGMTAGDDWRAVLLFTLAFSIAYTLGSLIQYAVGRVLGPVALSWLAPHQRERLESLVHRYGYGAVCWTRPLAIGNYVSIPAGMLKMNPIRFSLYTFLGAIPWAGVTILAGRLLGGRLAMVEATISLWMLPVVGLMALVAAGFGAVRLVRKGMLMRRPLGVR